MNGHQMRLRLLQKIVRLQQLNMLLLVICLVICTIQLYSSLMSTVITWLYIPFIALLVCVYRLVKRIRRLQTEVKEIRIDPQGATFVP